MSLLRFGNAGKPAKPFYGVARGHIFQSGRHLRQPAALPNPLDPKNFYRMVDFGQFAGLTKHESNSTI
jgi:hypothetical protein